MLVPRSDSQLILLLLMLPITIRQAITSDCIGIARVHIESWKTTYQGQIADEYLSRLSIADRTRQWEEWVARGDIGVLVAESGAEICGFVSFGACRDDDVEANTGEVYTIYLLTEAQGAGIGRSLWHEAAQRLRENGFKMAIAWVLTTNLLARSFYERVGCHFDGRTKTAVIGTQEISELRYRIHLG